MNETKALSGSDSRSHQLESGELQGLVDRHHAGAPRRRRGAPDHRAGAARGTDAGPRADALLLNRGFLVTQREGRRDDAADAAVREAAAAAEELGDADLPSAALDLVQTHEVEGGRYGDAYRTSLRRIELIPRLTDVKEIGDSYAVAARSAQYLGRYREAEALADACIQRARGIDSGRISTGSPGA
jgi:hypothetical protein